MAANKEDPNVEPAITEHEGNNDSLRGSDKGEKHETGVEGQSPREERVTFKAAVCVFLLSLAFGVPFWATPTTPYIGAQVLAEMGHPELTNWVVPGITTAATVTIFLFTTNSDLFGRRYFLLFSNAVNILAYILLATAKNPTMFLAGVGLNGAGSGTAGVALVACPELLPFKYRHSGVVLADAFVVILNGIGPVCAQAALNASNPDAWRYIYWAGLAIAALDFIGLAVLYFPPKHPRGVPWAEALRGMDWVGMLLFTPAAVLILVAITCTSYLPLNDIRIIVGFALGFALLIAFALWEQFSNVKYKMCPSHIFVSHRGREFGAPFCLAFIIVGFFYGLAVIYPTMLNDLYFDENTTVSTKMALALPANLGLLVGSSILLVFGRMIGHWRWSLIVSVSLLVLFGSLLAMVTPHNKALMITFACLGQVTYGFAAYLAVTFTQLGVPQELLGISGGLAGLSRYAGGAVASASYASAIGNGLREKGLQLIPKAAEKAGIAQDQIADLTATVIAGGPAGLAAKYPSLSKAAKDGIVLAYRWSAAHGLRNAALASLAFGVVGIGLAFYCEDIEYKMTDEIPVFLENDGLADHNKYH